MSELNFDLLKRLCETPGISSREEQMRKLVAEELRPLIRQPGSRCNGQCHRHEKGRGRRAARDDCRAYG